MEEVEERARNGSGSSPTSPGSEPPSPGSGPPGPAAGPPGLGGGPPGFKMSEGDWTCDEEG